ncbi:hypothetical protein [Parerythrobacter jejuensis]|uniref:DUF4175 domain-containing protein n=1 Tax=Parerythrobacter jejuensis TaxID=795812 RepID=A0A845AXG9_9SPHN|nr:hypothetical protein [Parerythrobacter jejuensis]MXP31145.1 hypothetical protein [Parerythrobacter jejuensis]MXP33905.1 hypothetical protein [Parerythrobacter jejuensis]
MTGLFEPGEWYLPKVYGYGAGWPLTWQGWALLLAYIAFLASLGLFAEWGSGLGAGVAFALFVPVTWLFAIVVKRKTRGGWRWRWGEWE